MKKCYSCNKDYIVHYRVKSQIQKTGFFAVKNVGRLFQNNIDIHMAEQGSQK